jgi:hypothetical protein
LEDAGNGAGHRGQTRKRPEAVSPPTGLRRNFSAFDLYATTARRCQEQNGNIIADLATVRAEPVEALSFFPN